MSSITPRLGRAAGILVLVFALLLTGCFTGPRIPTSPDDLPPVVPVEPPPVNTLTPAQREEVFVALWETARDNFPTFDLKQIDWEQVRTTYLDQVRQAPDDQTFERLLKETVAALKDSHAYLDFPMDERRQPGVRTLMDGDRVIISAVSPNSDAASAGILPGSELLSLNGQPVAERWAAHAATLSESTPYRLRWNSARTILFGLPDTEVAVVVRAPDGRVISVALKRTELTGPAGPPPSSNTLESGALYVRISTFDNPQVHAQSMAALQEAATTNPPVIIIDVRNNGGGDYHPGAEIASQLVGTAGPWGYVKLKSGQLRPIEVKPAAKTYSGPVILLINPGCLSACEAFADYFKRTGRGILVGEPTAGATFEAADYPLPHGYHLHMPGGRQLVGPDQDMIETRPVQPDLPVAPTAADFAAGRDPVLEKALSLIQYGTP